MYLYVKNDVSGLRLWKVRARKSKTDRRDRTYYHTAFTSGNNEFVYTITLFLNQRHRSVVKTGVSDFIPASPLLFFPFSSCCICSVDNTTSVANRGIFTLTANDSVGYADTGGHNRPKYWVFGHSGHYRIGAKVLNTSLN